MPESNVEYIKAKTPRLFATKGPLLVHPFRTLNEEFKKSVFYPQRKFLPSRDGGDVLRKFSTFVGRP